MPAAYDWHAWNVWNLFNNATLNHSSPNPYTYGNYISPSLWLSIFYHLTLLKCYSNITIVNSNLPLTVLTSISVSGIRLQMLSPGIKLINIYQVETKQYSSQTCGVLDSLPVVLQTNILSHVFVLNTLPYMKHTRTHTLFEHLFHRPRQ